MSEHAPSANGAYHLNELGWLQFERLCSLLLAEESGRRDLEWSGHADQVRSTVIDGLVELPMWEIRSDGRLQVLVVWTAGVSRAFENDWERLRLGAWSTDASRLPGSVVVMTDLDAAIASAAVAGSAVHQSVVVLGRRELEFALDRHASVRLALPSVLGRRDLTALIVPGAPGVSSLSVEQAQSLARVFWPTRAYERARDVLVRHRFVVLTGPPEMGKTAIAQMLALALMTDGWEAHECTSPDQVWSVFDPSRRQVFVADDAFGSTEFRPDAAERWARSLGRLLSDLDDDHRLIWTSRPAPLKAGLRRVQREHHAHHFPSPAEVLVDASDLDLAEKTLILFRHAKAAGLSDGARYLVRSCALTLVEHPHFTPERIRRFVADRLDALQRTAHRTGLQTVLDELGDELSTPTEAMRTSYRALGAEHRALLIALLDAPAGWIDERELTAIVRRHRPAGLSRAPTELIDRLTDHFLRVTPVGIGWVHPSWRDLVITELRDDPDARRRFLAASGLYGAMLALSVEGGVAGERALPLILDDRDWDVLGDRLATLVAELEDHQLAQLLLALEGLRSITIDSARKREARSLTTGVLAGLAHRWDRERRALPTSMLERWYQLAGWVTKPPPAPSLGHTWVELYPGSAPQLIVAEDLARADEWLALVQLIAEHDPQRFTELGFESQHERVFLALISELARQPSDASTAVILKMLDRIRDLGSQRAIEAAQNAIETLTRLPGDERWFNPEDILAPPTDELIDRSGSDFRREDVARVLADL